MTDTFPDHQITGTQLTSTGLMRVTFQRIIEMPADEYARLMEARRKDATEA